MTICRPIRAPPTNSLWISLFRFNADKLKSIRIHGKGEDKYNNIRIGKRRNEITYGGCRHCQQLTLNIHPPLNFCDNSTTCLLRSLPRIIDQNRSIWNDQRCCFTGTITSISFYQIFFHVYYILILLYQTPSH